MENKVWYLKQNRLFEDSGAEKVERWERIFTMRRYAKKTSVFGAGDAPRSVFLVKQGRVRISRLTSDGKEVTVAILRPGDVFGEEALFGNDARTTIATALDDALLCITSADDLFTLLEESPSVALNVAKLLSEKLIKLSAQAEDLAYAKISDRLLHLFERMIPEYGAPGPDGVRLDVDLTHADLAALIGSTRETVTAELAMLSRLGAIRIDGRTITLVARQVAS